MNLSRSLWLLAVAVTLAASASAQTLQTSHQPAAKAPASVPVKATAPAAPSSTPAVVARVNGTSISGAAFDEELKRVFPYFTMHGGQVPKEFEKDVRRKAVDNLISKELVYQEAVRRKLVITPLERQKRIAEIRKDYGASPAEFNAAVVKMFGSKAAFQEKLRHDMLIDKLFQMEVQRKAVVTDAEVLKEYESHKAAYVMPESVSFQSIAALFPKNATSEDKQKARKRIEDLYAKAKAAKNYDEFGVLAEKYSDDEYRVMMGEHKMVHKEAIDPVFKFVFSMKAGEISQIVESPAGYHIVRLNKHNMQKALTFAAVKADMKKGMQKERLKARNDSFHQLLRSKAKVEILVS